MSRATRALLAAVDTIDPDGAANDEIAADLATEEGAEGIDLLTWIDSFALTLAAGIRVGARGLVQAPAANDAPTSAAPPQRDRARRENEAISADDLADQVAKKVLRVLDARGTVPPVIGVSSREREEKVEWRDAKVGSASKAPTSTEIDGESTWSISEARKLLSRTRAKRKRGR